MAATKYTFVISSTPSIPMPSTPKDISDPTGLPLLDERDVVDESRKLPRLLAGLKEKASWNS